MVDLIKNYFSKYKIVSVNAVKKFEKLYPEAKLYLDKYLQEHPNWITKQNVITGLVKNITLPVCLFCKKELTYKQYLQHKKFCCQHCAAKFNSKNRSTKILNKKGRHTVQEKYHVKNVSQLPDIKEKVKQTYQQTCLNKFGFSNSSLLHGWNLILSYNKYIKPLFTKEQYLGFDHEYLFECCKCHKQFTSKIYITGHIERTGHFSRVPRCFHCYPTIDKTSSSKAEKELATFCREFFSNIKTNNSKLISPYEIDILIPEIKLAIEFNGLYWHNIYKKPIGYHLMKTKLCNIQGYRLIHIWEDDWINNKELIKNKLIDIFNFNEQLPTGPIIELPIDWYNHLHIPNYQLIKTLPPTFKLRANKYLVENCGKYIYQKL